MLDLRSALFFNMYRLDGCAVQIPLSPQDHEAKRYREIDTFCFFIPCRKLACRQRCEKQRERLAAFCAVGLQGPLRRAEGKGVKRSDHRERSSQFLSLRMICNGTMGQWDNGTMGQWDNGTMGQWDNGNPLNFPNLPNYHI